MSTIGKSEGRGGLPPSAVPDRTAAPGAAAQTTPTPRVDAAGAAAIDRFELGPTPLTEVAPTGAGIADRIAAGLGAIADPFIISALINGTGSVALHYAMGLPFDAGVIATFQVVGTAVGALYFPAKEAVSDALGTLSAKRKKAAPPAPAEASDGGGWLKAVGQRIAKGLGAVADSVVISGIINTVGTAACAYLFGIPPNPVVIASFVGIGTAIGTAYGPAKSALQSALAPDAAEATKTADPPPDATKG
jgi:hypothetical protein